MVGVKVGKKNSLMGNKHELNWKFICVYLLNETRPTKKPERLSNDKMKISRVRLPQENTWACTVKCLFTFW